MKNVLLVEPGYPTLYPPLGLMRISTWHKQAGDRVDFVKDPPVPPKNLGYKPPELQKQYDSIYITSLFTYHYPEVIACVRKYCSLYPTAKIKLGGVLATLLSDIIKKEIDIDIHIGLFEEVEECTPDYSLFPKIPYSLTFTSRGCFRGCKYCVVRLIEPKFFIREHWEKDVKPESKRIVFWDNNWLYSPNFYKDVEKLNQIDKPYDFNQGLDCRLFDNEKAKLLGQTKMYPLRFAFDTQSQDGPIQEAIKIGKEHVSHDVRIYVLYNSEEKYDTPEFFYYRLNELNKLKAVIYPMRYRPIDSINRHWTSPRWEKNVLRGLKLILVFFYKKGLIKKDRKMFLKMFGRNAEEFEQKMLEINAADRARWKKKRKTRGEQQNEK